MQKFQWRFCFSKYLQSTSIQSTSTCAYNGWAITQQFSHYVSALTNKTSVLTELILSWKDKTTLLISSVLFYDHCWEVPLQFFCKVTPEEVCNGWANTQQFSHGFVFQQLRVTYNTFKMSRVLYSSSICLQNLQDSPLSSKKHWTLHTCKDIQTIIMDFP